jgi:hypothetical protein
MNETARLPLTGTAQPLTELKAAMIASECTSALISALISVYRDQRVDTGSVFGFCYRGL